MRSQMRRGFSYSYERYQEPIALTIRAGGLLALVGALLCVAGPLGYRLGLLSLPIAADRVLVWGANVAAAGALLSLFGLVTTVRRRREARRGIGRAVLAIGVGVLGFAVGGRWPMTGSVPAIPDVTTDTENPPAYVAVLPLRGANVATSEYAGAVLAARQRSAFPDIQPLLLPVPRDQAFVQALTAVRGLGWTLVSADGTTGRIEASAATRLFGTIDDVVVRVSETAGGSRVDVRSTARELPGGPGRSTTAGHVRAVLSALAPS